MANVVELNGRLTPLDEARVPVTDLGLLYGIGLFETMRAYESRVFRLDQHLQRLLASAEKLQLPVTREMLPDGERVSALLAANDLSDARLRLTVTGGSPIREGVRHAVLLTAGVMEPYPPEYYSAGVTVRIGAQAQVTGDPLAGHKTTCYWSRLQAVHEGRLSGCVETLWFTENRQLAEGSISNVFVVKDGRLGTPPLNTPVLPGITRAAVIELCALQRIPCEQTAIDIDDLLDADEVFVCNSMMEIVPVCRVERKAIAAEEVGPLTRRIIRAYRELVRREALDPGT